jgi:hypothetical protein
MGTTLLVELPQGEEKHQTYRPTADVSPSASQIRLTLPQHGQIDISDRPLLDTLGYGYPLLYKQLMSSSDKQIFNTLFNHTWIRRAVTSKNGAGINEYFSLVKKLGEKGKLNPDQRATLASNFVRTSIWDGQGVATIEEAIHAGAPHVVNAYSHGVQTLIDSGLLDNASQHLLAPLFHSELERTILLQSIHGDENQRAAAKACDTMVQRVKAFAATSTGP